MATKLEISELDFDGIKSNLKNFLSQQDEFRDYDFEGSGMAVLLDMLAYNTHYLGFNANMLANEMFLDSADLRASVVSKAKQVGYTPTSSTASTATIDITVTKDDFVRNILPYKGENKIKVFNCDYIDVDKTSIKNVDLFLYDGDHSFESTKIAVEYFAETFAEECVLIFDDANWTGVVDGAIAGIEKAGLTIQYEKKMLNSIE